MFVGLTDDEKHGLRLRPAGDAKPGGVPEGLLLPKLILDGRIVAAIHGDLVRLNRYPRIIDQKPKGMELVLTERKCLMRLLKRADLITENKHDQTP